MESRRIKTDITVDWAILTNGQAASLSGRDLTLYLVDPERERTQLQFETMGNVIIFNFPASDQKYLGCYGLTLYENKDKEGQAVLDYPNAFKLVPLSIQETNE